MYTANIIESYFFPISATRGDESSAAILAKWDKLDTLSETCKDKLTSQKTAEQVQRISFTFNLGREQASRIAIAIRSYYFGELSLQDMPFLLAKEIPIDFSKAKEITNLITQKIINDNSQEIAYQAQLDHLPISEALKVYPEIGEQMITSERISLKNFPEPVRPSLKNWLADYTFTVGYDNTDSIKRGNYIFHGNNTLRLLAADREKLGYILKAHDEQSPITIDKVRKQIVFPAISKSSTLGESATHNAPPKARLFTPREDAQLKPSFSNPQQNASKLHNSVSFSSPQQLPYEKISTPQPAKQEFVSRVHPVKSSPERGAELFNRVKFPPIQQPRPINSVNNIVKLEPKPEKPREMPRNVVNLRDE
ncbi:MAG: hypothetical protein WC238_04450 [Parcubacteria group bacterium]|jgi:hypothetical protein